MNPFAGLPRRHYQIILADPPWKFKVYDEATGSSRAASNHYDVMDTAAICRLPVKDFAARDAALYLWTTAPFLQIAFDVMRALVSPIPRTPSGRRTSLALASGLGVSTSLCWSANAGNSARRRPPIVRRL